ncbi:MAG: CDP-alcohol phosphatidyltransferase family protein [Planctomycetota bacterium]
MEPPIGARRPLKSRDTAWARGLAQLVARAGVRPNQISFASAVLALLGGTCFLLTAQPLGAALRIGVLLAAAGCMQLRLVCNLIDGMVAVEGGMRSKTGEIWNELPDRFADGLFCVGAGYAQGAWAMQPVLGFTAAILAVITAYVRALGAAAGTGQHFCGPMAKQQRMAVLTLACLLAVAEVAMGWPARAVGAALALVVVGCVATIARRVARIAAILNSR